jgi:hypothetical protein
MPSSSAPGGPQMATSRLHPRAAPTSRPPKTWPTVRCRRRSSRASQRARSGSSARRGRADRPAPHPRGVPESWARPPGRSSDRSAVRRQHVQFPCATTSRTAQSVRSATSDRCGLRLPQASGPTARNATAATPMHSGSWRSTRPSQSMWPTRPSWSRGSRRRGRCPALHGLEIASKAGRRRRLCSRLAVGDDPVIPARQDCAHGRG